MVARALDIVANPDTHALRAEARALASIPWSDPIGGFALLIPSRKEAGLAAPPAGPRPGARVIATRNDFANGVANGDLGVMSGSGLVMINGATALYANGYQPAEALSFHMAQGNRFRTVAALVAESRTVTPEKALRVALAAATERVLLLSTPTLLEGLFRGVQGRPDPRRLAGFLQTHAPADWTVSWNHAPWFAAAPKPGSPIVLIP